MVQPEDMAETATRIVGAEVDGRIVDLRLRGGRIVAVGVGLAAAGAEAVIDAGGGALLPGLHDHHIHLLALAAARRSLRCGPPAVRDRDGLAAALAKAAPEGGWVRGVAYHASVAGRLDRAALDTLRADVPVRVQHRSGAEWVLNSAGCDALGLDTGGGPPGAERDASGRATGRLYREDAWLRERLGARPAPDLAPASAALAALGVSGVTDATPTNGAGELAVFARARAEGRLRQSLLMMGSGALPALHGDAGLVRGARKLVLTDHELGTPDEVARIIDTAHAQGREVAIHCVTRAELWVALAAFELAGVRVGDRIEHAAVAPPDGVEAISRLGLTVVTQPNFIAERGDAYAVDVEKNDRPWLYRCRGFDLAGVPLAGGTDAPFGEPDPWAAMRAAVDRRTPSGQRLGAAEALDPERALALFTTPALRPGGRPRAIEPGAPADLCLLEAPWARAREVMDGGLVRATWSAGVPIFERGA